MAWQPAPVFWPGESHGQRNLAVYSPWGRKDQTRLGTCTNKALSKHFTHIDSVNLYDSLREARVISIFIPFYK